MKLKIRKFLGNFYFIHLEVFLGLFALLGYIINGQKLLVFFVALSFAGAICGSFISVIDAVNKSNT
ncbi:MAG: hypothetical protein NTU81_00695 [Candidatus Nomurabacteria bacterium]|nr:hypothetical protein [Candidatus Nomurabacteria bacterium]